MSQHPSLFGTARIPTLKKDRLLRHPNSNAHCRPEKWSISYRLKLCHRVVIICCFSACFSNLSGYISGDIHSPETIHASLAHILNQKTSHDNNEDSVSVFTTENRDTWAQIRDELIADGNEAALKHIDSALFVVCLDDEAFGEDKPSDLVRNLLHGNGSNRYFHRSCK